jgi:hydrogenase-4 membrane subunit HyfE
MPWSVTNLAAVLVWLTASLMVIVKTPNSSRTLYRWQALGEFGLGLGLFLQLKADAVMAVAGLVLIIKWWLIPKLMARSPALHADAYGHTAVWGVSALAGIVLGLTIVGVWATTRLDAPSFLATGLLLAAWFIAWIQLVGRFEIWNAAWALLSLDTVSSSIVLGWGHPLPLIIDLSTLAITISLALLLAWLSGRIVQLRGTSDLRHLKELIG